ncbi:hypothetical protein [Streptomyces malaysiensis]|uniref:hypothetical protein n=1 Tax=Streptomyces malaysiensis TaxID=92644 RepID=UPI0036BC7C56
MDRDNVNEVAPEPTCPAGLLPRGTGPVGRCVVHGKHDTHQTADGTTWADADSKK